MAKYDTYAILKASCVPSMQATLYKQGNPLRVIVNGNETKGLRKRIVSRETNLYHEKLRQTHF
jgi:hypothetical protein